MKKTVTDLHLHSSYARATSRDLNFDSLTNWAKMKGIDLLSSADFTHPLWFQETKAKLHDNQNGFFSYNGCSFILGAEVSCIFSQGGKLRRVHLLLYTPTIEAAEKINVALGKRGKLASDGRPVLGLTAKNILEIVLTAHPDSIMIPAHVWTPWFGVLGQNGGFDSLQECFEDLTDYIYAIETGLSSDPAMNWRIKELDRRAIVSFSDAHSTPKMGRELTIFPETTSYHQLLKNLKEQSILKTIEFFPEEGKYHFNGHRLCNFKETPTQTLQRGSTCPVCKRPLTIGVMHRVEHLAEKDRPEGFVNNSRPSFTKLVPLLEVLSEATGYPVASKKTRELFNQVVQKFGNELEVLTSIPLESLGLEAGNKVSEAVGKVRNGDIYIDPGYDGVYGEVHIWPKESSSKASRNPVQTNIEPEVSKRNQLELF